jgi:ureidoacrylate peracid hydrolase
MMPDYRVIMVSDANAALTDEEHAATLNSFLVAFGVGLQTDGVSARLRPAAAGVEG